MITSKIGRRGQLTLPRSVRNWLGLQEGDKVAFVRRGDEIILHPLSKTLLDLRGSIPVEEPQDFDSVREQIREIRAQQVATDET